MKGSIEIMVTRIALWSTPVTRAPFLLRAFEARRDTSVSDEPLAGLSVAHARSPEYQDGGGEAWKRAIKSLSGRVPFGADVWIQKHLAPQLLPHIDRDWLRSFRHVFLVAAPRTLIARAIAAGGAPRIEETCIPHQVEIFRWARAHATTAPIVVCDDRCSAEPAEVLPNVCGSLGIPFDYGMLKPAAHLHGCGGAFYDGKDPVGVDSIPLKYEALVQRCEAMVQTMLEATSLVHC